MKKRTNKNIKTFILAGGLGTRLAPLLPDTPKGLAPIGSRCFLEILLEILKVQGFFEFIFLVGYNSGKIMDMFGDGKDFGVSIKYSCEDQESLMGTAGALKLAENHFDERILLINGDTYFDIDYQLFINKHLENVIKFKCGISLALSETEDDAQYGKVEISSNGLIVGFYEKKEGSKDSRALVNAGAYIVEKRILDYIPLNQNYSLEHQLLPKLLREKVTIGGIRFNNRFYDIGTPERFVKFVKLLLEDKTNKNV